MKKLFQLVSLFATLYFSAQCEENEIFRTGYDFTDLKGQKIFLDNFDKTNPNRIQEYIIKDVLLTENVYSKNPTEISTELKSKDLMFVGLYYASLYLDYQKKNKKDRDYVILNIPSDLSRNSSFITDARMKCYQAIYKNKVYIVEPSQSTQKHKAFYTKPDGYRFTVTKVSIETTDYGIKPVITFTGEDGDSFDVDPDMFVRHQFPLFTSLLPEAKYNEIKAAEKRKRDLLDKKKNDEEIARQARKDKLIRKYGKDIGELLISEYIDVGMTREQVIDSKGYPKEINRTVTSGGTSEQFVYIDKRTDKMIFIYVENNIVTAIQD